MSNVIETLLAIDKNKLELPKKNVKIKRLSDISQQDVVFTLQGVSQPILENIRDAATKINPQTKEVEIDRKQIQYETLLHGIESPNLRDKNLNDHYGVLTPYDLISKLLLPGEIEALSDQIGDLSGYGENVVEEIKN